MALFAIEDLKPAPRDGTYAVFSVNIRGRVGTARVELTSLVNAFGDHADARAWALRCLNSEVAAKSRGVVESDLLAGVNCRSPRADDRL